MSKNKSSSTQRKKQISKKNREVDNFMENFIKSNLRIINNDTIDNTRRLLFEIPIVSQTADRAYTISIDCQNTAPVIYCNCVSNFNPRAKRISNCKHVKLFLCQLLTSTKIDGEEGQQEGQQERQENTLASLMESINI